MVDRKKVVLVSLVIFGLGSELIFGDIVDDHGNNAASSTSLVAPWVSTAGDIEIGMDVDWFRFSGVEDWVLTIETILGTLPDSILTLYDSDGWTQIAFDDDSGLGLASMIEWTVPHNGTFYLEVGAFNSTQTGTYVVNIAPIPLPGAFLLGMLGLSVAGVKLRKHS